MARQRKTTLRDIAQDANLSESTVSRALAGNAAISDETRRLVEETARKLNYKSKKKQTLDAPREDRKGVIGVVVAALGNSFFPFLVDRVHGELNTLGYDMVLLIDEFSNSKGSRNIRSIVDNALDGVIFMTSSIESEAVDFLVDRNIPTVLAIRSNQMGNVDVLESDNRMAGRQAMQHLLSLGHRNIAMLLGPKHTSTALQRHEGAMQELHKTGMSIPETNVSWETLPMKVDIQISLSCGKTPKNQPPFSVGMM